jgi:hypothetical protein
VFNACISKIKEAEKEKVTVKNSVFLLYIKRANIILIAS